MFSARAGARARAGLTDGYAQDVDRRRVVIEESRDLAHAEHHMAEATAAWPPARFEPIRVRSRNRSPPARSRGGSVRQWRVDAGFRFWWQRDAYVRFRVVT